jgi:hypothetical protein
MKFTALNYNSPELCLNSKPRTRCIVFGENSISSISFVLLPFSSRAIFLQEREIGKSDHVRTFLASESIRE